MSKYHGLRTILSEAPTVSEPKKSEPEKSYVPRASIGDPKRIKQVRDDAAALAKVLGSTQQDVQQYFYGFGLIQSLRSGVRAETVGDYTNIETFKKLKKRNPTIFAHWNDESGAERVSEQYTMAVLKMRSAARGDNLSLNERFVETPTKWTKEAEAKYNKAKKEYDEVKSEYEQHLRNQKLLGGEDGTRIEKSDPRYDEYLEARKTKAIGSIINTIIRGTSEDDSSNDSIHQRQIDVVIQQLKGRHMISKEAFGKLDDIVTIITSRLKTIYPNTESSNITIPWIDTGANKVNTEKQLSEIENVVMNKIPGAPIPGAPDDTPGEPAGIYDLIFTPATKTKPKMAMLKPESNEEKAFFSWRDDYINRLINLKNLYRMYGAEAKAKVYDQIYTLHGSPTIEQMAKDPQYFKWLYHIVKNLLGEGQIELTIEQQNEYHKWFKLQKKPNDDMMIDGVVRIVCNSPSEEQAIKIISTAKTIPELTEVTEVNVKNVLDMYRKMTGKGISIPRIKLDTQEDFKKAIAICDHNVETSRNKMGVMKSVMDSAHLNYKNTNDPITALTSMVMEKLSKCGLDANVLKEFGSVNCGLVAIGNTVYSIIIVFTEMGKVTAKIEARSEDRYKSSLEKMMSPETRARLEINYDPQTEEAASAEGAEEAKLEEYERTSDILVEMITRMINEETEWIKWSDLPDPMKYGRGLPSWFDMYDAIWKSEAFAPHKPQKTKTASGHEKYKVDKVARYMLDMISPSKKSEKMPWKPAAEWLPKKEGAFAYEVDPAYKAAFEATLNHKKLHPSGITQGESDRSNLVNMYEKYGGWQHNIKTRIKANTSKNPKIDMLVRDIVHNLDALIGKATQKGFSNAKLELKLGKEDLARYRTLRNHLLTLKTQYAEPMSIMNKLYYFYTDDTQTEFVRKEAPSKEAAVAWFRSTYPSIPFSAVKVYDGERPEDPKTQAAPVEQPKPEPIKPVQQYGDILKRMKRIREPGETEETPVEETPVTESIIFEADDPRAYEQPTHDLTQFERQPRKKKNEAKANYAITIYIPKEEFIVTPSNGIYAGDPDINNDMQTYLAAKRYGTGANTPLGEIEDYAVRHKQELQQLLAQLRKDSPDDKTVDTVDTLEKRINNLNSIIQKFDNASKAYKTSKKPADMTNHIKELMIQMKVIDTLGAQLETMMEPEGTRFKAVRHPGVVDNLRNLIKRQYFNALSKIPSTQFLAQPLKDFFKIYGEPTYGLIHTGNFVFNGPKLYNTIYDALKEVADSTDTEGSLNIKHRTYNELAHELVSHLLNTSLKQIKHIGKMGLEDNDLIEGYVLGVKNIANIRKVWDNDERVLNHIYPSTTIPPDLSDEEKTKFIEDRDKLIIGISSKVINENLAERVYKHHFGGKAVVIKIGGVTFKPLIYKDPTDSTNQMMFSMAGITDTMLFDAPYSGTITKGMAVQIILLPEPMHVNIGGKEYRTYLLKSDVDHVTLNKIGKTEFSWDDPIVRAKYERLLWTNSRKALRDRHIDQVTLSKLDSDGIARLALQYLPDEVKNDREAGGSLGRHTDYELVITIPHKMLAYSAQGLKTEKDKYNAINASRQALTDAITTGLKEPKLVGYVTNIFTQESVEKIKNDIVAVENDVKDYTAQFKSGELSTETYDAAMNLLSTIKNRLEHALRGALGKREYTFQSFDLIGQTLEPGVSSISIDELGEREVLRFDRETGLVEIEMSVEDKVKIGDRFEVFNLKPEFEPAVVRRQKLQQDVTPIKTDNIVYGLADTIPGQEGSTVFRNFKNYIIQISNMHDYEKALKYATPIAPDFYKHRSKLMKSRWMEFYHRAQENNLDRDRARKLFINLVRLYDPDIVSEYGDPYMSKANWLKEVFNITIAGEKLDKITGGNKLLAEIVDKADDDDAVYDQAQINMLAKVTKAADGYIITADPAVVLIDSITNNVAAANEFPSKSKDKTKEWLRQVLNYAPDQFANIMIRHGFKDIPKLERTSYAIKWLKKNFPSSYIGTEIDRKTEDLSDAIQDTKEPDDFDFTQKREEDFPEELANIGHAKLLKRIRDNVKAQFIKRPQEKGESDEEYKNSLEGELKELITSKQEEFNNIWKIAKSGNPAQLNKYYNDPYTRSLLEEKEDKRIDVILENVRSTPVLRRLISYLAEKDENNIHNLYMTVMEHIRRAPKTEREKLRSLLEILV